MEHASFHGPEFVVGLALAVGLLCQILARHLRLPGIVLLLAAGAALGPDGAGVLRPESLGDGLGMLVRFAVAIILFEGGMSLNVRALQQQARTIRRLVTVGALITMAGGGLLAWLVMGWDWKQALLFGSLVVVTGPTVINPLLRRIHVNRELHTILEAEGIFIDAVGALLAVVVLEFVIQPSGSSFFAVPWNFLLLMGFGAALGAAGGALIAVALKARRRWHLVPDGLENVFTLSMVLGLFQVSNAVFAESGIVTVIAAGLLVGNLDVPVRRELMEFKEQLTVLMIGLIFVLLAADVRLADVRALGLPAVVTVALLMVLVRPVNVLASAVGPDLDWRDKAFLSWLAPRGIVAAAVASLFAETLAEEGMAGGVELRALVFSVIAATVLLQGLTGGLVARVLGVRRPTDVGYAILGANALGRALGRVLSRRDEPVVIIDTNPTDVRAAEEEGFRVVYGNALEERTLLQAEVDLRAAALAVTANDEVNLLFARRVRQELKVKGALVTIHRGEHVNRKIVERAGAQVLFGGPVDVEVWSLRLRRGRARLEAWSLERPEELDGAVADEDRPFPRDILATLLPLALRRGDRCFPVGHETRLKRRDTVILALDEDSVDETARWLQEHGWARVGDEDGIVFDPDNATRSS